MILVTGFPRSATGAASQLFTRNGLPIGHEVMGEKGISSWCHIGNGALPWLAEPVQNVSDQVSKVVHILRFPLDVFASSSTLTKEAITFLCDNLGRVVPEKLDLDLMANLWCDWNELIERKWPYCFRIKAEDMSNDRILNAMFHYVKKDLDGAFIYKADEKYNARPHAMLNWRQFRNTVSGTTYNRVIQKCIQYGYPIPEPVSLACCIMGKDEEHYLKKLFRSVKKVSGGEGRASFLPFYDELIYLDTGSSDRSIELAKANGAVVKTTKWMDDFSYHRNQLLEIAIERGHDWIIMIDCDEQFKGDYSQLKGLLADVPWNINALRVKMVDFKDGAPDRTWNVEKIFRTGKVIFKNRKHNRAIWKGPAPIYVDGYYEHHGYDISPKKMEKKMKDSERMLLKMQEENPENKDVLFYLVPIDAYFNRSKEALEKARDYILYYEQNGLNGINRSIFLPYCQLLCKVGEKEELERFYAWILGMDGNDLDVYYHMTVYGLDCKKAYFIREASERYLETYALFLQNPDKMKSYWYDYFNEKHFIFIHAVNVGELFRQAKQRYGILHANKNKVENGYKMAENVDKELARLGIKLEPTAIETRASA